ncbi:MAG TPA: IS4 family transposase [Oligoflexus sp.]|uniref:IS4 family transposase n=1 Tax=Oligoflexus sp. TaxID=1971216 RepID=UPI002D437EE4|nr:IS4 family transposase [Oligoflexus sp.]HYX37262.1 IS4 family transposase [Oligoflexus sp.]
MLARTRELPDLGNSWIEREFQHVEFGDERLNSRFYQTVHSLAGKSSGTIKQSCGEWKDVKGAYRLFANKKVVTDEILASHQIETAKRMSSHNILFAVQDTSYLDFDSHTKTKGLGSISKAYKKHKKGLMLHSSLILSSDGTPLGLSYQKCWSRDARNETKEEKSQRQYRTRIEDKESFKWIEALQETIRMTPPDTEIITIGDRESDIFEFMLAAESYQTSFLVRNRQNRRLTNADGVELNIAKQLATTPVARQIEVDVPKNTGRSSRYAQLEVKFTSGNIPIRINAVYGPQRKDRTINQNVHVYIVSAKETDPPSGEDPIDWILLTNVSVGCANEAVERIEWYGFRWRIEEYFRILKSGCAVENCRLSSADRLIKYITTMSVVAFKILYLSKVALIHPDEDCSKILSKEEWQALYRREHHTKEIPNDPPTIRNAVVWLGKLGGFMNRKSDHLPGPMILWRGFETLKESIAMWNIAKHENCG